MKHQNLIQGTATAGKVVFTILRVLCVIGAVCLLLSILALSFLPNNLFSMRLSGTLEMNVNLREIMGDQWKDVDLSGVDAAITETEDGIRIDQDVDVMAVQNRALALYLIPSLVELIVSYFFFRALSRAMNAIRERIHAPFSAEAAREFRAAGITLFVSAGAPVVCGTIISVLTASRTGTLNVGGNVDLMAILWGFLLLGLAALFEYGETLSPQPAPPAFNGYAYGAPADAPPAPQQPSAPEPPQEPSEPENKPDDNDFHPGAF